jgi:hypothetical protein
MDRHSILGKGRHLSSAALLWLELTIERLGLTLFNVALIYVILIANKELKKLTEKFICA